MTSKWNRIKNSCNGGINHEEFPIDQLAMRLISGKCILSRVTLNWPEIIDYSYGTLSPILPTPELSMKMNVDVDGSVDVIVNVTVDVNVTANLDVDIDVYVKCEL